VVYSRSLFAVIAYEFVYVADTFTGPVMIPASLLIAMITGGPPAGISPSGRNWVLSVLSVETYVALSTSELFTKLGGSTLATSAALCVESQCMVATMASTTFCTVSLCESTQLSARARRRLSFPVLRDKLLSYAQMRTRLSALRAPDQLAGVKGRSVHTLEAVEQLLMEAAEDLSAAEVAKRTGMSRATAQRYLSHLHEIGRVDIRLRYGSGGRPEHGYRWSDPAR